MNIKDILTVFLVVILWGLNFTLTKYALEVYPPFFCLFVRFFIVAIVLIPFVKFPNIALKEQLFLSIANGPIYLGLLYFAMKLGTPVSLSVIISQLNVPFTSLLAVYFLNDVIGWRRIFGMLISFTGVVIAIGPTNDFSFLQLFVLIISALGLAFYNVYIKKIGSVNILSLLAYSSALRQLNVATTYFII